MHTEILNTNQAQLIPWLKPFNRSYYLVGGTAIALHLGHRRSIDFDLFTKTNLIKHRIKSKLRQIPFHQVQIFEDYDQLHLMINNVKVTFFNYPYPITHQVKVGSLITMPTLPGLAAMKAFAMGRRAKWKDYIDMYFILRDHLTINQISRECEILFSGQFSEKLFRQQLAFHDDIDFSEPVEFLGEPVNEDTIKEFLIAKAIDFL
jgi:hypothetical protein